MKKLSALFFLCLFTLVFCSQSMAQEDNTEHSVIKAMPGASLNKKSSRHESYGTKKFRIKENGKPISKEISGEYWKLRYHFLDDKGNRKPISRAEIIDNYISAALGKGGRELNKGSNYATFSLPRKDGGMTYAHLTVSGTDYTLEIIEEKPLSPVLSFGAEDLKKALDADGHVAVYGINFDIDKALLLPGAEKVIIEIVKLMQIYPKIKIEIQGHTDNTGSADHNLDLSNRRAATVKDFMLLFGVEETRLISKGYGMGNPVAPNDSEENRARNRRVELVKIK